jgi:septal ring factor EnvC (AmiA/AmiB activator)
VQAVWDGKVVHAGWFKGFGNLLIIDHGENLYSLMAHLDQLEKAVGDQVHGGDEVGTVGDSGSLKGAYLYFELRDGQKPLNPERWLSRNRKPPALLAGAKGGVSP